MNGSWCFTHNCWQHGKSLPAVWPRQWGSLGIQGRPCHCPGQQWRGWGWRHEGEQSRRRCSWEPGNHVTETQYTEVRVQTLSFLRWDSTGCLPNMKHGNLHCRFVYLQSCFCIFVVVLWAPFPCESFFFLGAVKCRCLVSTRDDTDGWETFLLRKIPLQESCFTNGEVKIQYVLYLAANGWRARKNISWNKR